MSDSTSQCSRLHAAVPAPSAQGKCKEAQWPLKPCQTAPWPRDLKDIRFPALLKNTRGKEKRDLPVSACEDYKQTAPFMAAFTLPEDEMEV